jgi:hypothetical protein
MTTPDKKPDFSNVQTSVTSTEQARPDFSNVQTTVTTTEEIIGGEGGGGGTGEQTYTIEKGARSSRPTATSSRIPTGSSPARRSSCRRSMSTATAISTTHPRADRASRVMPSHRNFHNTALRTHP